MMESERRHQEIIGRLDGPMIDLFEAGLAAKISGDKGIP